METKASSRRLSIALVTDFFYPSKGGVETHVKTIGEELVCLGHTVIVITHRYKNYQGIVRLGSLLVYYLDIPVIASNDTLPTMFTNYVLFREIFHRHSIDVVHGHQSISNLCLEGIYHASNLNIRTVLTDHSVFEIAKMERILVNSLTRFMCKNIDNAICVSEVSKQNTSLRIAIPLDKITVIPNGIIPEVFYPIRKGRSDRIRVLVMSRLAFRKGIDLLIGVLPLICRHGRFEVVIVGDGPKKAEILQTIDENELHNAVTIRSEIHYEDVPDFLRSGDIFLNTSLTETFCLAILEAAVCGLLVVSTNVGGIREILDDGHIFFCEPTPTDIYQQLLRAADALDTHDPLALSMLIARKYSWKTIAGQVERVYQRIVEKKVGFASAMGQFTGLRSFLCRLGTFVEYLQITLFDRFLFKDSR